MPITTITTITTITPFTPLSYLYLKPCSYESTDDGDRLPAWAISQCPLIYGDLLVIASQPPDAGVVAYDKLTGKVVWKTPSLGAVGYVSPAVVKVGTDDHVVMITAATGRGANATGGRVVGIDGVTMWKTDRKPNFERGSIILADGLLVTTDGVTGLWLVEPDPTGFKPIVSAQKLREPDPEPGALDNQNWAPIALSDGKLLIRNQNRLICIRIAN